nr:hypothetical protein Iba_chr09dCG11000 [Ipomoea batatas]
MGTKIRDWGWGNFEFPFEDWGKDGEYSNLGGDGRKSVGEGEVGDVCNGEVATVVEENIDDGGMRTAHMTRNFLLAVDLWEAKNPKLAGNSKIHSLHL